MDHPDAVSARTRAFATRSSYAGRRSPGSFSGTVVVEWLNVSSGSDAAPDWTYLADEIVRRGHAWVGVSAQHVGVEGGDAVVGVAGVAPTGIKARERYAALNHPGDAYCYSIYATVAAALDDGPLADLVVDMRLAVGESQSAFALTTFVNVVHPRARVFDGFLIHSRGGAAMPLGEPGAGVDPRQYAVVRIAGADPRRPRRAGGHGRRPRPTCSARCATCRLGSRTRRTSASGRSPAPRTRTSSVIGEFEELLGCPRPVNRGQQAYVVRAALRWLDGWARGGDPAPTAARLEVDGDAFVRDEAGNTRGGVRTPVVDAPVEVLRGDTEPDASYLCQLFGSTLPMDPDLIRARYADRAAYLAAYAAATDAAIAAGFVLPEDREAVLAEARPDLVPCLTRGNGPDRSCPRRVRVVR